MTQAVIDFTFDRPADENVPAVLEFFRTVCDVKHVSDRDLKVFCQAFTTPGYGKEHGLPDYDRLEFLGDALIHHHVSRFVYKRYPKWDEGRLTKMCEHLWNNKVYPERMWDVDLHLTSLLLIPDSERNQTPGHVAKYVTSTTADCFEAVVGALDHTGNEDCARRFIELALLNDIQEIAGKVTRKDITQWDKVLNEKAKMMEDLFRARVSETMRNMAVTDRSDL